jgi:hypothetical protein
MIFQTPQVCILIAFLAEADSGDKIKEEREAGRTRTHGPEPEEHKSVGTEAIVAQEVRGCQHSDDTDDSSDDRGEWCPASAREAGHLGDNPTDSFMT